MWGLREQSRSASKSDLECSTLWCSNVTASWKCVCYKRKRAAKKMVVSDMQNPIQNPINPISKTNPKRQLRGVPTT